MTVSRMFDKKCLVFFVLSFLASPHASAQTPGGNYMPFASATPEIREFLIKAEAADKITDPLARCLAFPDLPGNKWPQGLVKAHCDFYYGPRIKLAKAKQLFDAGELDKLDALYAADLERHFSKENFSEIIHADFYDFDNSSKSDSFTKQWLEKAPDSPYALTARAYYFREMARAARGAKWAADTPDENVDQMGKFVSLAEELFQRALKIEPRLMPAYSALISMGTMDSRLDLRRNAIRNAKKIDPLCSVAINFEMASLTPRWGGSYEAMAKLSEEIAPYSGQRPLLANSMVASTADASDILFRDKKYAEMIELLKPATQISTLPVLYRDLSKAMQKIETSSRPETLMYLLLASRFEAEEDDSYFNTVRGWLILGESRQAEWAKKYLKLAVEKKPEDNFSRFQLAKASLFSGDFQSAETNYLITMKDPAYRQESLYDISTTYMRSKQPEKALVQVQVLNKEFPQYAQGWLFTSGVLRVLNKPGVNEAMQKFLDTADRSNPNVMKLVEQVQQQLQAAKK